MTKTCRYCEKEFSVRPGKPGFINECEECLEDRRVKIVVPVGRLSPVVKKSPRVLKAPDRAIMRSINEITKILGPDPILSELAERFRESMRRIRPRAKRPREVREKQGFYVVKVSESER